MHAAADPPAPTDDAPGGGWRDVAAVTFRHHLRGPWAVALAVVGLLPIVLGLVGVALAGDATGGGALARNVVPFLADVPYVVFPLLLLLLVVPAYRGAWLRDPGAARERVVGFFAGTWGAAAVSLLPWALGAFLLAAWADSVASAALATLVHLAALALMAAAWTAVGLLLAVAFRREETRWVALAMTYLVVRHLLPRVEMTTLSLWRQDAIIPYPTRPDWAMVFDVLDPGHLAALFAASLLPRTDGLLWWSDAGPLVGTPFWSLVFLAAWIAVPLLLAVRAQARAEEPLPPL